MQISGDFAVVVAAPGVHGGWGLGGSFLVLCWGTKEGGKFDQVPLQCPQPGAYPGQADIQTALEGLKCFQGRYPIARLGTLTTLWAPVQSGHKGTQRHWLKRTVGSMELAQGSEGAIARLSRGSFLAGRASRAACPSRSSGDL